MPERATFWSLRVWWANEDSLSHLRSFFYSKIDTGAHLMLLSYGVIGSQSSSRALRAASAAASR